MKTKIIILGDIHFPYHHQKALDEALYIIKSEKPTHVVQIGDLLDQYSFSRFTRKNITQSKEELEKGKFYSRDMWAKIRESKAKCYQIMGNHDIRAVKRTQERLPEAQEIVEKYVNELYQFKGVTTIQDDREILTIGDVSFHHGYLSKAGDHMRRHKSNMVVGHSHTGGITFEQQDGKTLFELNAGYLADETSEPLRYRPTNSSKWTLGLGLINNYGPQFIKL